MPIFDNLGLVPAPDDANDYKKIKIQEIVPPPEDKAKYKIDESTLIPSPKDDNYSPNIQRDFVKDLAPDNTVDLTQSVNDTVLPDNAESFDPVDDTIVVAPPLTLFTEDGEDVIGRENILLPSDTTEYTQESQMEVLPEVPLDPDISRSGPDGPPIDDEDYTIVPTLEILPDPNPDLQRNIFDVALAPIGEIGTGSFNAIDEALEGPSLPGDTSSQGNSILDQLFTGANQIFDMIGLPFPASITNLYQMTQTIEGYIEDPRMLWSELKDAAFGFIFAKEGESNWDDELGLIKSPEDSQYEAISGAYFPDDYGAADAENPIAEGVANQERADQIADDIAYSQFSFQGRKSVVGVSMRLNHLWDMRMEPWTPDLTKPEYCVLPPMLDHISEAYAAKSSGRSTESYKREGVATRLADWEDTMPILSYDLDFKTLANKEVELYGGSVISIPEIIRRTSHLTIQVLDDENKRWRRWFQHALEKMYDEETAVIVPYKHCCMKITLFQYRTDYRILSHKVFLGVIKNYQVLSSGSGQGAGAADLIDVEWSIVGELPVNSVINRNKDLAQAVDDGTDVKEVAEFVNIV